MRLFLIIASVALVIVVDARQNMRAESTWDMIGRAIEDGKNKQEFCTNNPEHDRCKPMTASTLLTRCESGLPENLGRCHGALTAFAQDGAKDLIEWRCAPPEALRDAEQLRRLFLREARRAPEVLHLPARQLVYYAVSKAFPCQFRAR